MVNRFRSNFFVLTVAVFVVAGLGPGHAQSCHPSYVNVCLPMNGPDVDCSNGRGNGPLYVNGPFLVIGPDPYDLDRDNDGIGCENG